MPNFSCFQYEAEVETLKGQLASQEESWQTRMTQRLLQKEAQTRREVDALTAQWNAEKKVSGVCGGVWQPPALLQGTKTSFLLRQELQRLSRVAADAFRSGADSVDLLKEQVAAQRCEIDELRRSHRWVGSGWPGGAGGRRLALHAKRWFLLQEGGVGAAGPAGGEAAPGQGPPWGRGEGGSAPGGGGRVRIPEEHLVSVHDGEGDAGIVDERVRAPF